MSKSLREGTNQRKERKRETYLSKVKYIQASFEICPQNMAFRPGWESG